MVALITLEVAKSHLRVEHSFEDAVIEGLAEAATDVVVGYLKRPDHGWTSETVPPRVRVAILLVMGVLYGDREGQTDPLTEAVRSLLHRDRDPAIA